VLVIIVIVLLYIRGQVRENSFWLALMMYSFFTAGSILVGRAGFGQAALLWSRYTTYSIPIVISLYVLFINLIHNKKQQTKSFSGVQAPPRGEPIKGYSMRCCHSYNGKPSAVKGDPCHGLKRVPLVAEGPHQPEAKILVNIGFVILLILIIAGNGFSYIKGYTVGKALNLERKIQALHVLTIEKHPDRALQGIFPSIPVLRYFAKRLKKLNYSVYSERDKYFLPLEQGLKKSQGKIK
jgi:hypothetical protein